MSTVQATRRHLMGTFLFSWLVAAAMLVASATQANAQARRAVASLPAANSFGKVRGKTLSSSLQYQAILRGKELFQREWVHQPPTIPDQGTMTDDQYKKVVKRLPGDGLGPMFNAKSCEACHAGGGAAGVDRNVTLITLDPRSPLISSQANRPIRANQPRAKKLEKEIDALFPAFIAPNGTLSLDVVVHEASTRSFYELIRQQLADGVPGGIDPTWFDSSQRTEQAIADQPVVAGRRGDLDYYLSQRNSPPLFGLGLIDQIPMDRLTNVARNQAARSKGKVTGRVGTGKFGWRAQTTTLQAFIVGACAGELGLQVSGTPQPPDMADITYFSLGDDLTTSDVYQLVSYVSSLPAPEHQQPLQEDWKSIRSGKRLFAKVGCTDCHVETITPARGIYSDLLLHDMGELLQAPSPASRGRLANIASASIPQFPRANRPFGSGRSLASYYGAGVSIQAFAFTRPAEPKFPYGRLPMEALEVSKNQLVTWDLLQREWRTPPLWGVADSAPYLHDGRAKTLDAAIRWHAGEAADSVTQYRSLTKEDRNHVLTFLKSLRAPNKQHQAIETERSDLATFNPPAKDDADPEAELMSMFKQAY